MEKLRSRAVKTLLRGRPWADSKVFLPLTSAEYDRKEGVTITLNARIEDVQKVLAKALKPERKFLSVVRFTNGKIEEVREAPSDEGKVLKLPEPKKEEPQPEVATTVARPVVGCPMPEFQEADIRASRVLEAFLNPDQVEDYRKFGTFVTVGADSGRRYLVANRERPNMLKKCGGRQLYDLEDNLPLCIHDWSVPPPEEMLALHLLLSTPGNETYVRTLPKAFEG